MIDDPKEPRPSESTPGPSGSVTALGSSMSLGAPVPFESVTTPGPSRYNREVQSKVSSYFRNTRPLDVNHQKRIDHQLSKMIVKG